MLTTLPGDPLDAVTHWNPYPYYDQLVTIAPFNWDDRLDLWVVAGAQQVETVFGLGAARVRPQGEAVPRALTDTEIGEVFSQFARMNDGLRHASLRGTVETLLAAFDDDTLQDKSEACGRRLNSSFAIASGACDLDAFIERFPVYVVASMLRVDSEDLANVFHAIRAFARSLAPTVSANDVAAGSAETRELIQRFTGSSTSRDASAVASAIGLLFQSYDATRGLIGNTLVALGTHEKILANVRRDPSVLGSVIEETLRYDSPVQNTRRFLAEDVTIDSHTLHAGEAILLVLAAANRDGAANPEPHRFDPARTNRRMFTFGVGAHACPSKAVASGIAAAAVRFILAGGVHPAHDCRPLHYKPSLNARIPLFARESSKSP